MEPMILKIKVQPNAKKDEALGFREGVLYVKLKAKPVDNEANQALVVFVAKLLGVRKSEVALVHGLKGRNKTLSVPQEAIQRYCSEAK